MTEQQYRVTADRDKGDDPIEQWRASGVAYFENRAHGEVGKWWLNQIRHIFGAESLAAVRIERPMPTTDRPDLTRDQFSNDESYYLATGQRPSLPTRELTAKAIYGHLDMAYGMEDALDMAAAVLALLQKGADRG